MQAMNTSIKRPPKKLSANAPAAASSAASVALSLILL